MKSQWKVAVIFVLVLLIIVLVTRTTIFRPKPSTTVKPSDVIDRPAETGQGTSGAVQQPAGRTLIEFEIHQDKELISVATFSEPPQFAIWLEEPVSHKLKTIFATYRSATGDMIGKAECPGCLPLWFAIYERETGTTGLPSPDSPAPQAVTGATPQEEQFKITREVEPGSKWICWMEMNLAGDFNEKYQEYSDESQSIDWDYSGQPALVYRCEITAIPGKTFVPELYGQVDMDKPFEEMIQPVSDDVTTAKDVFKFIKILITQAEPNAPN